MHQLMENYKNTKLFYKSTIKVGEALAKIQGVTLGGDNGTGCPVPAQDECSLLHKVKGHHKGGCGLCRDKMQDHQLQPATVGNTAYR